VVSQAQAYGEMVSVQSAVQVELPAAANSMTTRLTPEPVSAATFALNYAAKWRQATGCRFGGAR